MRIKRGETKRARHKKLLKQTKGFRMSYSKLYRRAKEAVLHAGQYSYAHRRRRSSQMRVEWIRTISAALVNTDYTYSKFISALKKSNIEIDRKNLAELAVYNPAHFTEVVKAL
jgi:large subunit ribosomal protein L20